MFLFGATKFVTTTNYFILLGILARIMSGMGAACFVTPFYAYVPIIYPDEVEKKIGFSELVAGLGFLLGPILGSLFYQLGGYLLPFIIFGGLTMIITPIIYVMLNRFTKR